VSGLTGRSRPTRNGLAPQGVLISVRLAAPSRCVRLTSNVRSHETTVPYSSRPHRDLYRGRSISTLRSASRGTGDSNRSRAADWSGLLLVVQSRGARARSDDSGSLRTMGRRLPYSWGADLLFPNAPLGTGNTCDCQGIWAVFLILLARLWCRGGRSWRPFVRCEPNKSFDADAQRRSFASLRSFPPVAGQLRR
jgi:hypothetical protein